MKDELRRGHESEFTGAFQIESMAEHWFWGVGLPAPGRRVNLLPTVSQV